MIELYRPGTHPVIKDFGYTPVDIWSVEITPRSEWGALPPKEDIETLPTPLKHIGFWGTEDIDDPANGGCCFTREECIMRMQALQKRHMEEGLPDIKYNFIIGDDGNIYEGRGWETRPAIYWDKSDNFKGLNNQMFEVGQIGIHNTKFVHYGMYESFIKLVGQGVAKKYLTEDYKMYDLYQVNPYEGLDDSDDADVEE